MSPSELPGKRKAAGQSKKQTRLFFGLSGGFSLCALRTAAPALLACPEAGNGTSASACACCFYGIKRRFSASLLTQKRSVSLPIQFQFVFAAFAVTNGVYLLLSLSQREKAPVRPFPSFNSGSFSHCNPGAKVL